MGLVGRSFWAVMGWKASMFGWVARGREFVDSLERLKK
jgi:hypothetical protein